jgi:hypothetical protein
MTAVAHRLPRALRYQRRMLVAYLVGGALISCTGGGHPEERIYSLPQTFCGVDVDVREYEALFPPGEEAVTVGSILEGGAAGICVIEVDGERAVQVEGFPREDDFEEMASAGPLDIDVSDGEPVPGEYDARVWPQVAMATDGCAWEGREDGYTMALYSFYPDDDDESIRVLSRLIQPYMRAIVESAPCVSNE